MKVLKIFLILLCFSSTAKASSLETALDQESQLLDGQIKELAIAQKDLRLNQQATIKALQEQFLKTQAELIFLQSQTQKANDDFLLLKSEFSNNQKIEERVEASWERLFKIISEKEAFYKLHDHLDGKQSWLEFKTGQEYASGKNKFVIIDRIFEFLENSQRSQKFSVNFLEGDGLQTQDVLRVGTLGAQVYGSQLPLAPSSQGVLSRPLSSSQFGTEGIFIFRELTKTNLKIDAGLWDRLIFNLPALFLGLLFFVVFSLFALFVKE